MLKCYRVDYVQENGLKAPLLDRFFSPMVYAELSMAQFRAHFEREEKHIPIVITEC
jgi:hypothetical protein